MDKTDVTFVIPTAPHALCPSTELIDEVVESIRHYFPTSDVYLLADGCADYLAAIPGRESAYAQYLDNCEGRWKGVHLRRFVKRTQQAEMTRRTLDEIKTKYLFFVEHDTPLRMDRSWDWGAMFRALETEANMIRLSYWEEGIHEAHEHLTYGEFHVDGVRFVRTKQYSQWPNIALTDFYRKMLREKIPEGIVTMIEIYLYGPALNEPEYYKIAMYCPVGPCQRFHHLNGRRGEPCDW